MLNGITDRTIDKNLFELDFKNKNIIKKESVKKKDSLKKKMSAEKHKIIENLNKEYLYSFSANQIELDETVNEKYKSIKDHEEELFRRNIIEEINKNENKISKNIFMNKKIFTISLLKDQTLLCKIKKSNVKMKYGKKITLYHLYTDFTNKFLMSCRKISNITFTEYVFTLDENPLEIISQENLIGKLVSRFLGNEFTIYDFTENKDNINDFNSRTNKFLGTIEYVNFTMF